MSAEASQVVVQMPARQQLPTAAASEAAMLIGMIDRLSSDPSVDIERVERMFALYEKAAARSAKASFLSALAEMQPELPTIEKNGTIGGNEKNDRGEKTGGKVAMAKYALWEDVVESIRPVLARHGFAISFRTAQPTADRILVTGVLGHRDGHTEETSMSLPIDSSGDKNNVQGWGSSVSYGKRYTAFALLNIVARGEDDDGRSAGTGAPDDPVISDGHVKTLLGAIEVTETDQAQFCKYFKIARVADLKASDFDRAMRALSKKASG